MDCYSPFYSKKGMIMIEDSESLELIRASNNFALNFFNELETKNRFLNQTLSSITKAENITQKYEGCMNSLYNKLDNLNPQKYDLNKKSLFGISGYQKYYKAVKKHEPQISSLISLLTDQQETLKEDNITLNIEAGKITTMIQELYDVYAEGQELEKKVQERITTLKNEVDIKNFTDSALLPLQRKLFEIQQMIAVKTQTILTLNIVQANNLTIIQNIDTIRNVTLDALKLLTSSAKAKNDQAMLIDCFKHTELQLNQSNTIVINTLPENDNKLNQLNTQ